MVFQRKSRGLANGASAIVLSMLLVAQGASAQDAVPPDESSDAGEAIIVTGSRIASGFNEPTPVTVVGADRLQERAA